jgi:type I restriction enzyme S subunit
MPSLNQAIVEHVPILLPPITDQRAIAHILGTLDDKIELNRRMNQTLEAMARALFKSWFVDFEPVRAKAEGRDPGLPQHLADLFPSRLVDSELGEKPEGWEVPYWGDLVTLEYGKSLRGYSTGTGKYPVYGTNGKIGHHSRPLSTKPGVIIGRKGAYRGVHFSSRPFFVIDTAFYVEPKKQIDLRWAYYQLLRLDINSMDSGSAIPSTSRQEFYTLPIVLPPFEIQQAFSSLLGPAWAKTISNSEEASRLAALRDALLPKLVSGELRVKDAERFIGRAMG